MSRFWRQALGVLLLVCSLPALAHEMSLAELSLHEISPGEFQWQWGLTEKRPPYEVLKPIWPEGCVAEDLTVRCTNGAMKGPLTIEGVGQTYSAVLLKIQWADGQDSTYTLTGAKPTVQLFGSARDQRGFAEIASVYLRLGVEHILSGYDHLLFVCSLLFLVGFTRKLVWTLTAFTLAHSITLALCALDILTLRPPPVEANIALSIMLVAGEALHSRETLARRWPALIAFLFGLVHGLGFAGGLKAIGLPDHYLPAALLSFNVGVEAGNLLVVALAWPVWLLIRRWPVAVRARTPILYGIGTMAAYWSWIRIVAILS